MFAQKMPQWLVAATVLIITVGATAFLFVVVPIILIRPLVIEKQFEDAEDVFSIVSHVAAVAITYWFASRNNGNGNGGVPGKTKGGEKHWGRDEKQNESD
ncbi:MAG: hypothetical protein OXM87_05150 [Truepera sp.]|nr:hypothetical protein [Truepera sp.]